MHTHRNGERYGELEWEKETIHAQASLDLKMAAADEYFAFIRDTLCWNTCSCFTLAQILHIRRMCIIIHRNTMTYTTHTHHIRTCVSRALLWTFIFTWLANTIHNGALVWRHAHSPAHIHKFLCICHCVRVEFLFRLDVQLLARYFIRC